MGEPDSATCFASWSAFSFPVTLMWLGTQQTPIDLFREVASIMAVWMFRTRGWGEFIFFIPCIRLDESVNMVMLLQLESITVLRAS